VSLYHCRETAPDPDTTMTSTDTLILEQQPYLKALARNIAKTLPHHVDYDELVAFGQVGLAEAARSFDGTRGVSFTTFAHYRIRGAIFDGLRKMTWLPPAARRGITEQAATDEIAQTVKTGAPAASDAPVDESERLARQFSQAVERLGAVFLISSVRDDEPGIEPADRRSTAPAALEVRELHSRIRVAMQQLPDDLGTMMRMLYVENKSMSEVGELLGKNKSTVCRRHAEAIDFIRVSMGVPAPQSKPDAGKDPRQRVRREMT
jgi:RNA polymerase sigma factor for flagellar operon FliA